jgi:hypothetical protein
MWDSITAIFGGPKHCGWCYDKPNSWFMNFHDGYGPKSEQPFFTRIVWTLIDLNTRLGLWKIGQEWHFRVHWKRTGKATWR